MHNIQWDFKTIDGYQFIINSNEKEIPTVGDIKKHKNPKQNSDEMVEYEVTRVIETPKCKGSGLLAVAVVTAEQK